MKPDYKGILVILDGLGDRRAPALDGATPLEAARTPHLDRLVRDGSCGLLDPLLPGVPVATHTGVGVLMGLAPTEALDLPRGPVEASGVGIDLDPGDVSLRANFATLKRNGTGMEVIDRRAGRIREGTEELASLIHDVSLADGVRATLFPATQHRAVLRLRGGDLSASVTDTDPGAGKRPGPVNDCRPDGSTDMAAHRTAAAVNEFIHLAHDRLVDHPINRARAEKGQLPANGILTRGAGFVRRYSNLIRHLGMDAAVVSGEKTVIGLANMFGFEVFTDPGFTTLDDTHLDLKVERAAAAAEENDLVILHIKGADICAHDFDAARKRDFLERVDQALEPLLTRDRVIGIAADHSTDSNVGRHCGDPVPSILYSPVSRVDGCQRFDEATSVQGGLGRITGHAFLISLLDLMGCLITYGPADRRYLVGES